MTVTRSRYLSFASELISKLDAASASERKDVIIAQLEATFGSPVQVADDNLREGTAAKLAEQCFASLPHDEHPAMMDVIAVALGGWDSALEAIRAQNSEAQERTSSHTYFFETVTKHVKERMAETTTETDQAESPFGTIGYMFTLENEIAELKSAHDAVTALKFDSVIVSKMPETGWTRADDDHWSVTTNGHVLGKNGKLAKITPWLETSLGFVTHHAFGKDEAIKEGQTLADIIQRTEADGRSVYAPIEIDDLKLGSPGSFVSVQGVLDAVNAELQQRSEAHKVERLADMHAAKG